MSETTTPWPLVPGSLVTARFAQVYGDSSDEDYNTEWVPLVGQKLIFTPSITGPIVYDPAGAKIIAELKPFLGVVNPDGFVVATDGGHPIRLLPTNDPLMSRTGWLWTCTWSGVKVSFPAASSGEVNIADYITAPINDPVVAGWATDIPDMIATINSAGTTAVDAAATATATAVAAAGSADAAAVSAGLAAGSAIEAEAARDQTVAAAVNVPRSLDDDGTYALLWQTRVGRRVLGGITPDGKIAPAGGVLLGADTLAGDNDPALTRLTLHPPTFGRAHLHAAEDALGSDGNFTLAGLAHMAYRMPGVRPKGRGIICRGDSLTAGAYGAGVTYPGHLATLCPGVPVAKRGNPGERSKEIAMRQGSEPLVTTGAVTIPASGAVTVPMNTAIMFTNPNGVNGTPDGTAMTGSINGVAGRLTITGGVFTFTRSTAGDALDVPTGTPWLDDWESSRRDWNQIIWAGRNNVTTTPADVATYVAKMATYQTGGDYVVLSVTNSTTEPAGSANYITIAGINAALAVAHGPRFFDLRAWLIASGLAAVSIAPTAVDTTAIGQDRIPPSLLAADGLHLNSDGYKATAIGVRAFINERGWL